MSPPSLDPFEVEAGCLEDDIQYTAKCHFAHEQGERRIHWSLGIGGSVLPVLAAAAILRDVGGDWLAGGLALGATLCSAVLTVAKPGESADQHSRSGRALNALKVELRQFRGLDLGVAAVRPDEARARLKTFADRKATIDCDAPSISERHYQQARRKIRDDKL